MIEIDDVTVRHRGSTRDALSHVTLSIPRGATLALLGPSGCGKSTLLRALVGLVDVDGGRVRIDGLDPRAAHSQLSVQRRIGYVIQEGGLFPHLSGLANVALLARHLGWSEERVRERVDTLARLVRLDAVELARFPTQLSGGQRQRVAIMRALFTDPDVLLLDEPLGALDPIVRAELQDELASLVSTVRTVNKTTVLVTHDLAEAAHLATSFALMRDGKIVVSGSLEDLRARAASDAFVARFMNAHRTLALPAELSR